MCVFLCVLYMLDSICIIYLYDFRYFRLFEFRKIVSNRELCYKLIPPDYPVEITKVTNAHQTKCPLPLYSFENKSFLLEKKKN